MSAANASAPSSSVEDARRAHEPSMEEILASIRRIIADDDGGAERRKDRFAAERRRAESSARPADADGHAAEVRAPEHERPQMSPAEILRRALAAESEAQPEEHQAEHEAEAAHIEPAYAHDEAAYAPEYAHEHEEHIAHAAGYDAPQDPRAYAQDPHAYAPEPHAYAPEPHVYAPEPHSYAPEPRAYAEDYAASGHADIDLDYGEAPRIETFAVDAPRHALVAHEPEPLEADYAHPGHAEPVAAAPAYAPAPEAPLVRAVAAEPVSAPAVAETEEGAAPLVSAGAAASIASHFQTLAATMIMNDSGLLQQHARELLRPMLKQWLDDNLPVMVERLVRAEIERVARGGRF